MHHIYKILLCMIFVVGISENSHSQNQSHLLDLRSCGKSCTSKNYSILEVYLSDINGNPVTNSLLNCTSGIEQTTFISFKYQTSSNSQVNNARLFTDLKVGESSQFLNYYFGIIEPASTDPKILTLSNFPLVWTCGLEVSLNNPLLTWTTSASADLSNTYNCNDYPSGQCQFQSNIILNAPLAAQFENSYSCPVNGLTSVTFTNTTNGGRATYQYNWTFTNASISTSNLMDPSIDFVGPGTASLTVTDSNGTVSTFHADVDIPTSIVYNPVITHQTDEEEPNGSIVIEINNPENFTFSWIGSNGFVSDERNIFGLPEGTYQVTVTDLFGCSQTMELELFYFITLPLVRDDLRASLKSDNQRVNLNWSSKLPIGTGHFEVERSLGDISEFTVVGKLPITDWATNNFNYAFTDASLPKTHSRIYYRVKLVPEFGKSIYTATIKVDIPLRQSDMKWSAFPNPFENNLQLKYLGNVLPFGELIKIQIHSPSTSYTKQFNTKENPVELGNIIQAAPKGLLIIEINYLDKVDIVKVFKR
jgi:hypothetical protein